MNAYETRRARWLKLAEHLPPELINRIALRNIRMVIGLSARAQATLACALDTGLRQARVIRLLRDDPELSLDELIRLCHQKRKPRQNGHITSENFTEPESIAALTGLIQACLPGWSSLAAETLAADPLTAELRALLSAWHSCQVSKRFPSETFTILLCGFLVQAAETLTHTLNTHPNLQTALQTSPIGWPFSPLNPTALPEAIHP